MKPIKRYGIKNGNIIALVCKTAAQAANLARKNMLSVQTYGNPQIITGRMSSRQPNLQSIPKVPIKGSLPVHFYNPAEIMAKTMVHVLLHAPLAIVRGEITKIQDEIIINGDVKMLRDQNFTVKDHILIGTSFFAHDRFGVDYALAQNFKAAALVHEHVNFILLRESVHIRYKMNPKGTTEMHVVDGCPIEDKLRAFGCPFSDAQDYIAMTSTTTGILPDHLVAFKAVFSKQLHADYCKWKKHKEPFAPKWLNHHADEDGPIAVLQALIDHYTFPGSTEYKLY